MKRNQNEKEPVSLLEIHPFSIRSFIEDLLDSSEENDEMAILFN